MDIEIVIAKTKELLILSETYKSKDLIKSTIDSSDSGNLLIGNVNLDVSGSEYISLRNAESTELTTELTATKTAMQELVNEINTEID